MKRILTIFVAMAAFLATENTADAQILKKLFGGKSETPATETVSAATTNGQAAGAALKALYTQYKADGKLDMGNLTNLVNNVDLSGLTASAEDKAQSAASALTEKLAGASEKANTAVENATEIASAVSNILNLFK